MKEYSYKESGIEWLGKIPEHWVLKRLGAMGHFSKGGGISKADLVEEGLDAILYGDIYTTYEIKAEEIKNKIDSEVAESSKQIFSGDLLFTGSGETIEEIGKCIVFDGKKEAYAGGDLIIFRQKKYDSLFLSYVLNSELGIHQKAKTAKGDIVVHTYASKLKNIYIPLPPLPEQKAIADYLDAACQKIDRVIELKEKQIEKMNSHLASKFHEVLTKGIKNEELIDPQINWMGKMPKSWERKRLKDILHLKSGDGITSTEIRSEGEYPVYGGNGLRGYSDSFTHEGFFPLIGRQGALCGNINYAKGKFWASEHAVVATPTRKINVYWVGELMRVMNLNQYSNAAAQPGLAVEKIKNLYIPYPGFEQQNEIADYLKGYEEKTKRSVSIIENQIRVLKNYRKSLIHECVTGKKRVYEVDLPKEAEMA